MGLLVCMALAAAALFLPIFNIVAFEQMLYFAGESAVQRPTGTGDQKRHQDKGRQRFLVVVSAAAVVELCTV